MEKHRDDDFGFIAEEVNKINPLLASYNGKGEVIGVKYRQLTAVLTNAMMEQQEQIEELKGIICSNNLKAEFC